MGFASESRQCIRLGPWLPDLCGPLPTMVPMKCAARGALTALRACLRGNRPRDAGIPRPYPPDSGHDDGPCPDNGGSFDVDVSRVDESSYAFLKSGDAMTIVGVVSTDGNKVIAEAITPDQ